MTAKLTPQQVAAFNLRLTGGKADPEAVGRRFAEQAADMEAVAARAGTGRYRGFTAKQAMATAADLRSRAVTVPACMRDLLAGGDL